MTERYFMWNSSSSHVLIGLLLIFNLAAAVHAQPLLKQSLKSEKTSSNAPASAAVWGRRSVLAQQGLQQTTAKLTNGPIREFWSEGKGTCGEFSVQTAAAHKGHWVSQAAARWLAGGGVLISEREGENLRLLLKKLGLFNNYWRKQPVQGDGLQRYMLWVKQQVLGGLIVVFGARYKGGKDPEYDHLMPLYGVQTSVGPSQYSPQDVFTWATGTRVEISRAPSAPSFFATSVATCQYEMDEGGCISSSTPTYGAAVGGLPDEHEIYLPIRLQITAWDNGEPAYAEPRKGHVLDSYLLDLSPAASILEDSEKFTIFRFDMVKSFSTSQHISSGSVVANQPSLAALKAICKAAGPDCKSKIFNVEEVDAYVIKDAAKYLGKLPASSVVFFIAVEGS